MNVDLSIHRIALRETASLAVAQALVALKRQDLELKIASEAKRDAEEPRAAAVKTALRKLEDASEARPPGMGRLTDKWV